MSTSFVTEQDCLGNIRHGITQNDH